MDLPIHWRISWCHYDWHVIHNVNNKCYCYIELLFSLFHFVYNYFVFYFTLFMYNYFVLFFWHIQWHNQCKRGHTPKSGKESYKEKEMKEKEIGSWLPSPTSRAGLDSVGLIKSRLLQDILSMFAIPLLMIVFYGIASLKSRAVSHDRTEPTNQPPDGQVCLCSWPLYCFTNLLSFINI